MDTTSENARSGPAQDQEGDASANPFCCNICKRTYKRVDHLSRHYRSRQFRPQPDSSRALYRFPNVVWQILKSGPFPATFAINRLPGCLFHL